MKLIIKPQLLFPMHLFESTSSRNNIMYLRYLCETSEESELSFHKKKSFFQNYNNFICTS